VKRSRLMTPPRPSMMRCGAGAEGVGGVNDVGEVGGRDGDAGGLDEAVGDAEVVGESAGAVEADVELDEHVADEAVGAGEVGGEEREDRGLVFAPGMKLVATPDDHAARGHGGHDTLRVVRVSRRGLRARARIARLSRAVNQVSSQSSTESCHIRLLAGLSTQWFSSGKCSRRLGIPRRCRAVKVAMPWDVGDAVVEAAVDDEHRQAPLVDVVGRGCGARGSGPSASTGRCAPTRRTTAPRWRSTSCGCRTRRRG
jgi:hypothetical protein